MQNITFLTQEIAELLQLVLKRTLYSISVYLSIYIYIYPRDYTFQTIFACTEFGQYNENSINLNLFLYFFIHA